MTAIIDGIILAIVVLAINAIFAGIADYKPDDDPDHVADRSADQHSHHRRLQGLFRSWPAVGDIRQDGLKVVTESGGRALPKEAFLRIWPRWLNQLAELDSLLLLGSRFNFLISLLILAVFTTFFTDQQGRCIHDQTAKIQVIKASRAAVA